jgi:cation transport regulator ChaB
MSNKQTDLPSTLKRSSTKAQRTWQKTHDSAVQQYGEGRRAHMTAFASLKHSYEKIGDHWEEKDHKGPSDPKSEKSYSDPGYDQAESYGGVDERGSSKKELQAKAKKLGISGYSNMNKKELAEAIHKSNEEQTARSRKT